MDRVSDTSLDFPRIWRAPSRPSTRDGIPAQQRAFLRLARFVGLLDGTALVAVPNDYTKDVVETRVRDAGDPALSSSSASRCGSPSPSTPRSTSAPADDTTGELRRAARRPSSEDADAGRPDQTAPCSTVTRRRRRRAAAPSARRAPERHRRVGDPAQPEVHLRHLRHRREQPVRPRRRRRGGRGAGQGLQPAVRLRRVRAGQDPPAARDRPLRAQPLPRRAGALRELRGVHQRLHQQHPRRQGRATSSAGTATSTCC